MYKSKEGTEPRTEKKAECYRRFELCKKSLISQVRLLS